MRSDRFRLQRPAAALLVAALTLACSSCGGEAAKQRKPTFPVEGKLYWKNERTAAAHALIVFHPLSDATPASWPEGFPRAKVGADGAFKMRTYTPDDGAPAGEYAVLVQWAVNAAPDSEEREAPDGEDRFEGVLSDPQNPRWRKTVKPGENDPKDFIFIIR